VPEPYRSPDWALVAAKTGLRAEYYSYYYYYYYYYCCYYYYYYYY
jgi:hypothetical protein